MTSKIKNSIKGLESMLSSVCYPVENKEDDDDILRKSLSNLLSPNSSWSVFLDIREIADKSNRSLKSCPHSLRLLSYQNSNLSFICHLCNNNSVDASLDEAEGTEPDLEVEEEESQVSDVRKNAESSPPSSSKEKTESDEEIDQLLMDTPEKEKEENNKSSETGASATTGLKLRDLSELLERTSSLPTFSSSRVEDGTNPMQSIPVYQADLTLTDETSARSPPGSYSLKILNNPGHILPILPIRTSVLRASVCSAPPLVRTVAAVRVTRPPPASVTMASSRISQAQSLIKTHQVAAQSPPPRPAPAQYLHYPSSSSSSSSLSLSQTRGGGKVRAKLVSVPRPSGQPVQPVQPVQPYPQLSNLQLVQHRPTAPPPAFPQQVSLVQLRAPPPPSQVNLVQQRAPPPPPAQVRTVRQPLYTDPRLPPGWSRVINVLPDRSCVVTILDHMGRMFRNRQELQRFIITSGEIGLVNPNKIDFSVFGEHL